MSPVLKDLTYSISENFVVSNTRNDPEPLSQPAIFISLLKKKSNKIKGVAGLMNQALRRRWFGMVAKLIKLIASSS